MLSCLKRDHRNFFCLVQRFKSTTAVDPADLADSNNTEAVNIKNDDSTDLQDKAPEIYILHKKRFLSTRLQEIKDKGGVEWLRIRMKKYKVVTAPDDIPVSTLAHGLDKVLFRSGVHYLKNPKTKEYNFTSYLEDIIQPSDIKMDTLSSYVTSSKDTKLLEMARENESRYIGSTSSVSATLSQFYFLMSNFRYLNISKLSPEFKAMSCRFTKGAKVASTISLKWKDGVYAIDADKSIDNEETILTEMGKSLEKVLTSEPETFTKYLKDSEEILNPEDIIKPESYAYGKFEKFLLRSQLDCHHPKLARKTFDLKTRAVIPVRLDLENYKKYLGYSLKTNRGLYESFEREYYDMIRSAFLKYSFQVRIGHMDGILVAYHNTKKIFGFQYISRRSMDRHLFGASKVGDKVLSYSLSLFQSVLDKATETFPQQTLRISFETMEKSGEGVMKAFVEAVPTEEHDTEQYLLQSYDDLKIFEVRTEAYVNENLVVGALRFKNPQKDKLTLYYNINELLEDDLEAKKREFRHMRNRQLAIYRKRDVNSNPILEMLHRMSEDTLEKELEETCK